MVGKTLSHYEILEQLGAGGMGVVYRARDTRLNRSVALKVLPPQWMADAERRARFMQEARSASAVTHPAIAQIHDVDEADGVAFIAMELVEGRTVRRLVADRELDLLGAVEIAAQVADGLGKAHAAGIVHRDIKSDNIMVTPDGHAKILDFGLAKPYGDSEVPAGEDPEATLHRTLMTHPGMVVGTLAYMSPEQARSRPLDPRSDLFSLGVVLYEMVAGQLPFQGDSPLDTLHAIAFEESRPVTALRANVPPNLQRVVAKCLRKQPQDRYESAEALVKDLRAVGREIDSGITMSVPLADRLREKVLSLRGAPPSEWIVPGAVALGVLLLVVLLIVARANAIRALAVTVGLGFLVFRRFKNQRYRLVQGFAKQVRKMPEVRLVAASDEQLTVVVDRPLAKTYVRLNSLLERMNKKLFTGRHFTMAVREHVTDEEMRRLLESGVAYVSDDVELAPRGAGVAER